MYTVYRIDNLINKRFYYGVHKTKKPDDGYMGSGIVIKRAIRKYGKRSFTKTILFVFNSSEEAYSKERELVDSRLIEDSRSYNLIKGGAPGPEWTDERRAHYSRTFKTFLGKKHSEEAKQRIRESCTGRLHSEKQKNRCRKAERVELLIGRVRHNQQNQTLREEWRTFRFLRLSAQTVIKECHHRTLVDGILITVNN